MAKKKSSSPKKSRPRTLRRTQQRHVQKLVAERVALARAEVGGRAGRPIEVASAAVVESRATSLGCAVCAGALRELAHDALTVEEIALRRVGARCVECDTEREVWVRIVAPLSN